MKKNAVNWNEIEDQFSQTFWKQNLEQFWVEDEVPVSHDKDHYASLTPEEKDAFRKVLGGLTLLDTKQGGDGMNLIGYHCPRLQARAVFSFMGAMEQVHAKSYSYIFTTLETTENINQVFEWVESDPHLIKKRDLITDRYKKLLAESVSEEDYYDALVASVFLESFLFYSGFFYPLFLAGQGKMASSGEIITLICRDEAVHGLFTGLLAIEIFEKFSEEKKAEIKERTDEFLEELYENEVTYTKSIYDKIGLTDDVLAFVRYNANRAYTNLGFDAYFDEEEINPIVQNGLDTGTKNHDFFSQKGNGYIKTTNVEELKDEDFVF
ncbi:MAG: class 1b ribonucleoside-diphosphate reductase subunit beta [Bacilli bacterium]